MPYWEQPQPGSKAASEVVDTLKGAALIATFLGFLAMCAASVALRTEEGIAIHRDRAMGLGQRRFCGVLVGNVHFWFPSP